MPALPELPYLLIAAATGFVAIVVLTSTVAAYVADRRALYRGLRAIRDIELDTDGVRKKELAAPVTKRVIVPAIERLGRFGRRLTPVGVVERLDEELGYAGRPPGLDAERILVLKVVVPLVLAIGTVAMTFVADLPLIRAWIMGGFLVLVGFYMPEWYVRSKAGARQEEIQDTLPDSLDLLTITVEAGLAFDAALARVAREAGGPLGEELHRVVQEVQLGEERIEALRGLGERNNVPELKSFVLAMIQANILGVPVGRVLNVQAKEMRLKRRQRAEEKAQKLPLKMLFPLIFCMFPGLFVALIGPAILTIGELF